MIDNIRNNFFNLLYNELTNYYILKNDKRGCIVSNIVLHIF